MFSDKFDRLRVVARELSTVQKSTEDRHKFFEQVNALWNFEHFDLETLFPIKFELAKQDKSEDFILKVLIKNGTSVCFRREFCRFICTLRGGKKSNFVYQPTESWIPGNNLIFYTNVKFKGTGIKCLIYVSMVLPNSLRIPLLETKAFLAFKINSFIISPLDFVAVCKESINSVLLCQKIGSKSYSERYIKVSPQLVEFLTKSYLFEESFCAWLKSSKLEIKIDKDSDWNVIHFKSGNDHLVDSIHSSTVYEAVKRNGLVISSDVPHELKVSQHLTTLVLRIMFDISWLGS